MRRIGPVQMGGLAVLTLLVLATAALDRVGINPGEALYVLVLGLTTTGYIWYERRGKQRQ